MPHTIWNLGTLVASARVQPRQFVAGIEPAQGIVIGGSREMKPMLVILDAWIEVNEFRTDNSNNWHQGKYSLALGKDPLNTALLLPVGSVSYMGVDSGVGMTDQPATATNAMVNGFFKAQGTMWAVKQIAIDFQEAVNTLAVCDVDVHLDWGVAFVDWWTWFVGWNNLEASPDGNLVDGDRTYA